MTLLIGTVSRSTKPSKSHVLITADGRCTGYDGMTRAIRSNTYRKIFPIAGTAVVLVHHGENIISGMPVDEFLASFHMRHPVTDGATIGEIADSLKKYADQQARDTLRMIPASKIIGFWIAGFGQTRRRPELVEICWEKVGAAGDVRFHDRRDPNRVFMLGGDAQEFVRKYHEEPIDGVYDWKKIPQHDRNYAARFHASSTRSPKRFNPRSKSIYSAGTSTKF